jgi:excisionase family DNA binding protein
MDTFLTVREAAEVLRISKSKAYALVSSGELPHVRFGKVVRIPRSWLDDWLEGQRAGRPTPPDPGTMRAKARALPSMVEDDPWRSGLTGRGKSG